MTGLLTPSNQQLAPVRQLFIDSDQLIFRAEVDLDAAACALAHDADLRAEQKLEPILSRARVDVDRLRRRGVTTWCTAFHELLHERLGLAHREAARDDIAGDP